MVDATWVAFGGAVAGFGGALVGVIGKGLWDWWLAVGKVRADREARAEERREKRLERRDELQRKTLLDAQDALMRKMRLTAQCKLHDDKAEKAGQRRNSNILPDTLDEGLRLVTVELRLLRSRVKDDDLKRAMDDFSMECTKVLFPPSGSSADDLIMRASNTLDYLLDRSGELVLKLDEV